MLGFGAILLLLGGIVALAYETISNLEVSQRRLVDEDFRASVAMAQITSNVNHQRADLLELLVSSQTDVSFPTVVKEMEGRSNTIDRLAEDCKTIFEQRDIADQTAALGEFLETLKEYRKSRGEVLELIRVDRREEALVLARGLLSTQVETAREQLQGLSDRLGETTAAVVKKAQARTQEVFRLVALLSALALALGVFLVWLMNLLIAAPLQIVTSMAERVARRWARPLTG